MSDLTLTEAERESIGERACWNCHDRDPWANVESILAARLAEVTAERDMWRQRAEQGKVALHSTVIENARLRDTLARVEALADEWEPVKIPGRLVHDDVFREHARDLRAALAGGDS